MNYQTNWREWIRNPFFNRNDTNLSINKIERNWSDNIFVCKLEKRKTSEKQEGYVFINVWNQLNIYQKQFWIKIMCVKRYLIQKRISTKAKKNNNQKTNSNVSNIHVEKNSLKKHGSSNFHINNHNKWKTHDFFLWFL